MQRWKELSLAGKIVMILQMFAGFIAFGCAAMQMFTFRNDMLKFCIPMLGVVNLCNACLQWKANRRIAYFSAGTAAFVFIVSAVVILS